MALSNQLAQQAVIVPQDKMTANRGATRLALFDEDGNPFTFSGGVGSSIVILDVGENLPDPPVDGVLYLRLVDGTTPDVTPPSVPTGLVSSLITTTGFKVTWSASTDAVGVTGYQVRIGTNTPIDVTSLFYSFTGLTESTTYSVTVRAKDAAGNWSDWSTALSVTTATVVSAVSIFGSSAYPGTWSGLMDGPAKIGTGFYTTLAEGMDVVGARLYLPSGLSSSFYDETIFVYTLVKSHTSGGTVTVANVNSATQQNSFTNPRNAGWNEIMFESPIHVNQYASGTNNSIFIELLWSVSPNYVYSHDLASASVNSTLKPGVFLAEMNFPRSVNDLAGGVTTISYPIDILVSP